MCNVSRKSQPNRSIFIDRTVEQENWSTDTSYLLNVNTCIINRTVVLNYFSYFIPVISHISHLTLSSTHCMICLVSWFFQSRIMLEYSYKKTSSNADKHNEREIINISIFGIWILLKYYWRKIQPKLYCYLSFLFSPIQPSKHKSRN